MNFRSFVASAATSFWRCLFIVGTPFALTLLSIGIRLDIEEGILSFERVLHNAAICALGGVLMSLFVYYLLFVPFLRPRMKDNDKRPGGGYE